MTSVRVDFSETSKAKPTNDLVKTRGVQKLSFFRFSNKFNVVPSANESMPDVMGVLKNLLKLKKWRECSKLPWT